MSTRSCLKPTTSSLNIDSIFVEGNHTWLGVRAVSGIDSRFTLYDGIHSAPFRAGESDETSEHVALVQG